MVGSGRAGGARLRPIGINGRRRIVDRRQLLPEDQRSSPVLDRWRAVVAESTWSGIRHEGVASNWTIELEWAVELCRYQREWRQRGLTGLSSAGCCPRRDFGLGVNRILTARGERCGSGDGEKKTCTHYTTSEKKSVGRNNGLNLSEFEPVVVATNRAV